VLVTVDDLTTYLDHRLTNREEDIANLILEGLHYQVEDYLKRPIEIRSFSERFIVEATYKQSIYANTMYDTTLATDLVGAHIVRLLPYTVSFNYSPVVSVDSVTVNADNELLVDINYVVRKWGIEINNVRANDIIDVEYQAGLDTEMTKHIKIMILRAAAREMTVQTDDTVGIKDLTSNRSQGESTPASGFTDAELKSIDRWRRKRIA
jgi:hypothetical protein